ncbi:MAG: hypothetical protein P8Y51_02975, partial [Campylobacterales bacterium]
TDRTPAVRAKRAASDTAEPETGEAKPSEATGEAKTAQMSDFEAAMWMQSLRRQTKTHLYKITPDPSKGGQHVDPW